MWKFLLVSLIVCMLKLHIKNEDFILNHSMYYSLKVHNNVVTDYAITLCYKV